MTQLVLVYYTHLYPLAWALLFFCFESLWPVAQVCWQDHRHRRKKALPLKMSQKWHANGANSQNHSKIWSNTGRADDGVRILSGGGHEGICHFIWQELIKVSVPRIFLAQLSFLTTILFKENAHQYEVVVVYICKAKCVPNFQNPYWTLDVGSERLCCD